MRALTALALATLASSTLAQSFNVDIGSLSAGAAGGGLPAPVFGAASNRTGPWNAITGLALGPFALVDVHGSPTSVTCSRSDGLGTFFGWNSSSTTGYFQSLMDGGHGVAVGGGTSVTYTFDGLAAGSYDVYTYAWSPLDSGDRTDVVVVGSTSANPQTVGGALPALNTFQLGVTHAIHAVDVAQGAPLTITCSNAVDAGTINGFQICRGFELGMAQAASGSFLSIANSGGTPFNIYVNLVSVTQGSFPNGPLFGLDLAPAVAVAELAFGPPFLGLLDANGAATFLASPPPAGPTFYCVGIELGLDLSIVSVTEPFQYTLL